ncbi:hypothetical protein H0B56_04365 [Haloechinothrix sp. YIM 98757]|uniref:Uncharacterized protein n=1 Tax=Haloechinothrix aidingensis TaxID=2752311 RepID=A0A838A8I5_9PSEU|nr:hypothetical protein [Haloechinothrix aidingensis]MBA0124769.1 hypothetical protein [Haloechinothrix aidingensis]
MIDDSNPDYRRARMRFEPVMGQFRARAERVKEETDARAVEIAEYERTVEERRRAREDGPDEQTADFRGSEARPHPRPTRGRHAKPDEDEFDEDDFSNNNFLR